MRILVTGGAGYIASHTIIGLVEAGHEVVVLDNLCNSKIVAVERVREILGVDIPFHEVDVRHEQNVVALLDTYAIDTVVHFAGLKSVGESVAEPTRYYDNNVIGSISLLKAAAQCGVRRLVFSSSATVYGQDSPSPMSEETPLLPVNPYGRSKLMVEDLLRDHCGANPDFAVAILRYFNPAGAHPSGRIGEDPIGPPANLVPFVAQVAVGRHPKVLVFGNDYPTPDGTGVRDYIHVVDLAAGHVAALDHIARRIGCFTFNLGTGAGHSVLDVVRRFEEVSGRPIPYEFAPRRGGDVAETFADPAKALRELGWTTTRSLSDICRDVWQWQSRNPVGYGA